MYGTLDRELRIAVRKGKEEKVKNIIDSVGLLYSSKWKEGYDLLCDALKYKYKNVAQLLLKYGAAVNIDNCGHTAPLHYAVLNNDLETIKMILNNGGNINALNEKNKSPLHLAVENTKLDIVSLLLRNGAYVNGRDSDGKTPLLIATNVSSLKIVENFKNSSKRSKMIEEYVFKIIQELLKYGAYVNTLCGCSDCLWKPSRIPLHFAAECGNIEIVKLLLKHGARVNTSDRNGKTPLHIASSKGFSNVVECLIEYGAFVDYLSSKGTPLHYAAKNGHTEIMKILLNEGADINACADDRKTPLLVATENLQLDAVKILLRYNCNINVRNINGETALFISVLKDAYSLIHEFSFYEPEGDYKSKKLLLYSAVKSGDINLATEIMNTVELSWPESYMLICNSLHFKHVDLARLFMDDEFKANNVLYEDSNNLLHFAVGNGNQDLVHYFLINDAAVNLKNECGETALHIAVEENHVEITKLLLTKGADVNVKNNFGMSPLIIAAEKGYLSILEDLIAFKAYVNSRCTRSDKKGYSALHFAFQNKYSFIGGVVDLLLRNGADINAKDKDGVTPLHLAIQAGFSPDDIIEYFIKNGADINYACTSWKEGYTPLHLAVEKGNEEIVKLLLSQKCNVDALAKNNVSSLQIAIQKGYVDITKYLIKSGACVNFVSQGGYTSIHFAAADGNVEVCKLLLNMKCNINAETHDRKTPLHIAVEKCHDAIVVRFFLEHGSQIEAVTKDGKTALYIAAELGNVVLVNEILKHQPSLEVRGNKLALCAAICSELYDYHLVRKEILQDLLKYGFTFNSEILTQSEILCKFIEYGFNEILELILKNITVSCNINSFINCSLGSVPLHIASEEGNLETVKLLLKFGADANAVNSKRKTAIYNAILSYSLESNRLQTDISSFKSYYVPDPNRFLDIIKVLLDYKTDVNYIGGENNETPLYYSVRLGNEVIVKLLLEKGANVNWKNKEGVDALHIAAEKGFSDIVSLLLLYNANVNSLTANGLTPLHLAGRQGFFTIVSKLLENEADINILSNDKKTVLDFVCEGLRLEDEECLDSNNPSSDQNYRLTNDFIKKYIIMLKISGEYVHKSLDITDNWPEMINFITSCQNEIEDMKTRMIDGIRYYDILLEKNFKKLASLSRKQIIIDDIECTSSFQNYYLLLRRKIKIGKVRYKLLQEIKECDYSLLNFSKLPSDFLNNLFNHLNNFDLSNLISAFNHTHVNYCDIASNKISQFSQNKKIKLF